MPEFDPSRAHELVLEVRTPTSDPGTFALTLADREGHTGSGFFAFQSERPLDGDMSWGDFLRAYLEQEPAADFVALFGRDLFRAVIAEQPELAEAWSGARGAAGSRPLALTVDLGRNTERFAVLPLELLDDGSGHVFARPESSLRRAYQETPEKEFTRPAASRVLFAWACPPLAGDRFDPEPHWQALGRVFDVPLHWYAARRRKERELDEDRCWQRALRGFADFAEACDARITGGAIVDGVDRLLHERRTLEELAGWVVRHGEDGGERSLTARLARALRNAFLSAGEWEILEQLARAGRREARELGDAAGEANCLQSLGDLHMRVDDLDAARASYEEALPLFREIRARLGEANCLQSQALLELAEGRAPHAFRMFLDVLEAHREIGNALGEQAALGYLARTAHAVGAADQALALAETSLEVGRRIRDRFGQTITLGLQIGIWLEAQELTPAVAAILVHRGLCREIGDQAGAQRYQPLLDQILPSLPEEARRKFEENAEEIRQQSVRAAMERLQAVGRDSFEPPVDASSGDPPSR